MGFELPHSDAPCILFATATRTAGRLDLCIRFAIRIDHRFPYLPSYATSMHRIDYLERMDWKNRFVGLSAAGRAVVFRDHPNA